MCIELELSDELKRKAAKLRASRPSDMAGYAEWEEKVAKAVDGLGGPLAQDFCGAAGVLT